MGRAVLAALALTAIPLAAQAQRLTHLVTGRTADVSVPVFTTTAGDVVFLPAPVAEALAADSAGVVVPDSVAREVLPDSLAALLQGGGGGKSPVVAFALNFFLFPGLGNFYAGNTGHGVRHLLLHIGGLAVAVGGALSAADEVLDSNGNVVVPAGSLTVAYVGLTVVLVNWVWSLVSGPMDASAAGSQALAGARLRSMALSSPTIRQVAPGGGQRVGLQLASFTF